MMQAIKYFLLPLCCLLVFAGCEDSFRPDPVDPRLPKYSEEGKNTAGALVNGKVWRAVGNCSFMGCSNDLNLLYYENSAGGIDSVGLSISGNFINGEPAASMTFILKGFENSSLANLPDLVGVYDLDADVHKGYYNACLAQSGRLEIRYAGRKGGTDSKRYVLAGTFSLYVAGGACGLTTVEYGRFDFNVF